MNAKGVAYIVAAVLLAVLVVANWTLFATPVELNLLVARVQAPPIVLMLLLVGVIWLSASAGHALSRRAWGRERDALRKELELARARAEHEEESRIGGLRITMERELAAIRAQIDRLQEGYSARSARSLETRTPDPRPPEPRGLEPELIPPRTDRR